MIKKILQTLLGKPTGYVSDADQFLEALRENNPKLSTSQQREVTEYDKIARLRDGHAPSPLKTNLWRDF